MLHNHRLVQLLQKRGYTLAFAESMTCGMAASNIASVKGASDVLMGSLVCYHEDVKQCALGVSRRVLKKHTAESRQTTEAMAKNLRRIIPADVHAAVTGLAAPGGSESKRKPVGTVFFAVRFRSKLHHARKKFNGSPSEIRKQACDFLYKEIMRIVR